LSYVLFFFDIHLAFYNFSSFFIPSLFS